MDIRDKVLDSGKGSVEAWARAEGLAEHLPELRATVAAQELSPQGSTCTWMLYLNTSIANRGRQDGKTDVVLRVAQGGQAQAVAGVFMRPNAIVFPGIRSTRASGDAVIKVEGLRCDALQLSVGGGIAPTVRAVLTRDVDGNRVILHRWDSACRIKPGYGFSVGRSYTGIEIWSKLLAKDRSAGLPLSILAFNEHFPGAFKNRAEEGSGAQSGTLLCVQFGGIPDGAVIHVTRREILAPGRVSRVAIRCLSEGEHTVVEDESGLEMVSLVSVGGTASAEWEWIAPNLKSDGYSGREVSFGVRVVGVVNSGAIGGVTVRGGLGPTIQPGMSIWSMDTIPRFVNRSSRIDLFPKLGPEFESLGTRELAPCNGPKRPLERLLFS